MLLVATTAVATSIVPPANLGDLARASDAVVLAVAGRSHVVSSGPLLFTLTNFRVQRWVAGVLSAHETMVVRVPGGELDGWTWAVPGFPHFQPGQVYLLFLHADPRGQWQPQAAAYGVLRRITGRDGTTLLAPLPEMTQVEMFPRPDGILPEAVGTYQEALVVPELSAVAARRVTWSAKAVLARSAEVPFDASIEGTPPTGCTYITSSTPYPRWPYNTSSSPGQVNIYYSPSGGDATVPGGGTSQLAGAVGMWMGIPSISLNISYAGLKAGYTMSCTDANCQSGGHPVPCYNDFPNAGMVVFNDPCSEVPVGNELAFGGPWWGLQHTFDGTAWYSIISQFVVVSATAYSRTGSSLSNYQEMLAHELGHGLGYGHFTSDPNSVMYPYCCNTIDATDVTCTQYTYPAPGPTATPTWTPTPGPTPTSGPTPTPTWRPTAGPTPTNTPTPPSSPPAAPSGVSASDGAYADHVHVNWNASSGADGYQVWRNVAASTQTATYLSAVTGMDYDDTSVNPGTVYYYWVRAHNAAGWSGYSTSDNGFAGATTTPTPTPTPVVTPTPTPGLTPTPSALAASFAFSGPAPVAGRAVQFTDTSSGVPRSWQWAFGDGASANVRNPAHTYALRGTYTVTLRVGDGTSTAQISRAITVGARARRHLNEK